MLGDLRQSRESILRKNDLVAGLREKNLGASPDGIAVVDYEDLDARVT
jgi:hypothetical protein